MTAGTPDIFGPYGRVVDGVLINGARYNTIHPQLSRDFIVAHTYESGDLLDLERVKANLRTPGNRPTGRPLTYPNGTPALDPEGNPIAGLYGVCYHGFPDVATGSYWEPLDERHNPNAGGGVPNRRGLHFCFFGRARQTRAEWLDAGSYPQLVCFARYVADKAPVHGIPVRHVAAWDWAADRADPAAVKLLTSPGKVGLVGHKDLTAAGIWGGSHWDPGPEFPWDIVIDLVEQLSGGDMPRIVTVYDDTTWQQSSPEAFVMAGQTLEWVQSLEQLAALTTLGAATLDRSTGKPFGIWRSQLRHFRRVGAVWADSPFAATEFMVAA